MLDKGLVEHIDFEKFIEGQKGVNMIHKERKNLGMTYVYILEMQDDKEGPSIKEQLKEKEDLKKELEEKEALKKENKE